MVAIFDPAHIIKLVRNAFGENKIFLDYENNEINFEYVPRLCFLQEQEGCHLANKLRKNHILFFKQKMKVKLVTPDETPSLRMWYNKLAIFKGQ